MRVPRRVDGYLRAARSRVFKHLYRDRAGGPERAIIIHGVARSGTTWLAELLASQLHARLVFEPFNPGRCSAYRTFEYVQYARPDRDDPELHAFVSDVLSGRLRDPRWMDRLVSVLRPEWRVIKAVRACLMLRWIHDHFPTTPTFLIVRHPCAVAASFQRLGWSARPDLDSMLRQGDLVDDHLGDVVKLLTTSGPAHREVAMAWCVNTRVALRQAHGSDVVPIYYERLRQRPEDVLPRIFEAVGVPFDPSAYAVLSRPSRTSKPGPRPEGVDRGTPGPAWRRALRPEQIEEIEEIVGAFGLAHLYDDRGEPTGALRHAPA